MTLLGHNTAAELRDWMSAIDYEVGQIEKAFGAFAPAWKANDSPAFNAWSEDWRTFRTRLGAARAAAALALAKAAVSPVPNSLIPVDDEWNGLHRVLAPTPGTIAKGDLQDLQTRLAAAQKKPIDFSQMPQPTATDVDLATFKVADGAIRAGDAAARDLAPAARGGGVVALVAGIAVVGVAFAAVASRPRM